MHLKSITHTLHSATGQPVTTDLAKRQIITGKNRVGKTAILDAISLTLSGYIARLGKSGDKLEPIVGSCQEAQAIAEFIDKDGRKGGNTRSFILTKNKDGSISKKASFDLKSPLTPLIIDSSLFLAAKASDRLAMIQSAAGVDPKRFAKLTADIRKKFPLVSQNLSKSADLGEYATETEANLALAIKETKASLDRQKKAAAASIEHSAAIRGVDYNESRHFELRTTVKQLENTIAVANASISSVGDVVELLPPAVQRPELSVEAIQKRLRELAGKKASINLAARDARVAQEELSRIEDAAKVQECPCCGAKREHWIKNESNKDRESELRSIIDKTPTDAAFDDLEAEISDANDDLGAAHAWEQYESELASRKELDAKREQALAASQALLKSSQDKLPALQVELTAMDAARDGFVAARAQADQEKRIEETRAAMEAELAQLVEARSFIKAELTKLSNDMMIPILEKANLFTKDIIPPLVCANFRLGYEQDGQWVALEGFSGSEMAIATAAIQAALMTQDDLKAIIVDEAQRIDPELLAAFAANIERAMDDGVIEQAIIAGSRLDESASLFDKTAAWSTLVLK